MDIVQAIILALIQGITEFLPISSSGHLILPSEVLGWPDQLAWMIVLATIPAGLAGLLFNDFIEANLRSSLVIATTTILFGILLGFADLRPNKQKDLYQIGISAALFIGCAQALALIPGTSRSGITITAALLLGFSREGSAKFSFLMSIPII